VYGVFTLHYIKKLRLRRRKGAKHHKGAYNNMQNLKIKKAKRPWRIKLFSVGVEKC